MRSFLMTDDEVRLISAYRTLPQPLQEIMLDSIMELAAPEVTAPVPNSPLTPVAA
jgi:hypothetical protein